MEFRHAAALRAAFPELNVGVIRARGPFAEAASSPTVVALVERARGRLAAGGEGEFPEISAWRRAFSRMGLKPTQYRSASEALLRRLRQEGSLPAIHPAIDLANAVSVGFAVPIAVFDLDHVEGWLEVRHAVGDEVYLTFAGAEEHPDPGEVIFADAAGRAHARRWCNRQSGLSALRPATREVLVVAEAMHDGGAETMDRLVETLAAALRDHGATVLSSGRPSPDRPVFDFEPPRR